jgi:hypothetical protein
MSTTANPVTMIDPQGVARTVPGDAVAQAPAEWKTATKMIDTQGTPRWMPTDAVNDARQHNYAVHPENPGAQKMVTPGGQITYALPNEVQQFEASGHTKIAPDGRFEVKPLPGEDSTATMQRAVNVGRALGPEQMQQSMNAEKAWWISKEGLKDEAAGAVNVGLTGAETLSTLAGGSAAAQGAKAGLSALGETETAQLIKSSPRLYAEYVLKHPALREVAAKAGAKAIDVVGTGLGAGGAYLAYKWLKGSITAEAE